MGVGAQTQAAPKGVISENVHEHPLFAKFSIHDSLKVKIAPVHSDFWRGNPDIRTETR